MPLNKSTQDRLHCARSKTAPALSCATRSRRTIANCGWRCRLSFVPKLPAAPVIKTRGANGVSIADHSKRRCLTDAPESRSSMCRYPRESSIGNLHAMHLPLLAIPVQVFVQFHGVIGPGAKTTPHLDWQLGILSQSRDVVRSEFGIVL